MNFKYSFNLWKPLKMLLTLQKRIKDEYATIKQTQLNEIKKSCKLITTIIFLTIIFFEIRSKFGF